MDTASVIIRPFNKEEDQAMIYSTWRNSSYYSAVKRPEGIARKVFKQKSIDINTILNNATIRIACLEDSPLTIIGYSISSGDHLNWIYVKDDYRRKGIATLLLPKNIKTVTEELTQIGKYLTDKKKLITKGDFNGRTNEGHNQDPKETNPQLH